MDALKSVREASKMAYSLCPQKGIFFKTTVSTLIDVSSLFSLSVVDLCDYTNLTIRIRCYEIVEEVIKHSRIPFSNRFDEEPTSGPGFSNQLLATPTNWVSDAMQNRDVPHSSQGRPLSVSRQVLSVSRAEKGGNFGSANRTELAQAGQYVHPDYCRVIMETTLHGFYEGLVVLRALYSVLSPLATRLQTIRIVLSRWEDVQRSVEDIDLVIKGNLQTILESIQVLDYDVQQKDQISDGDSSKDLFHSYESGIAMIQNGLDDVGLDGNSFFEMCRQSCFGRASNRPDSVFLTARDFLLLIVDAIEHSLFRGVVSCFDCDENLVIKGKISEEEGKKDSVRQEKICCVVKELLSLRDEREFSLSEKDCFYGDAVQLLQGARADESEEHACMDQSNNGVEGPDYDRANDLVYRDDQENPEINGEMTVPYNQLDAEAAAREGTQRSANSDDIYSSAEGGDAGGSIAPNKSVWDCELRAGADDWTTHLDEDSGYYYIYSATLQESRWMNV